MRLSPTTGKGLMGQGGGTISIDGVVPASLAGHPAGGWGWLDDTTAAGQADIAGYLLRKLVLPNTLTVLDATATGATDAAQNFRAGNSEWAAWMSGGTLKGTRSATIPFASGTVIGTCTVLPLTGLGDIDETGRSVLIANYAGDAGLVAYTAAGAKLWTANTSVLDGNNRVRAKDGSVAYQDTSSNWHLLSATTGLSQSFAPRTDEVVAATVPVSISGAIWVVELTNTKLTIRPATSSNGYVLATSANLFNPDAVSMSAGTVRVGWSISTGESNTDMRIADLNITSGGLSTGTTASGALVITAQSPATPSALPVGPVEGGTTNATKQPRAAMKADGSGFVGSGGVRQYQAWWDTLAGQSAEAITASHVAPPASPPSFGTVDVSGQSPVVATVSGDAVQLIAGTNITITTDAGAQSVTLNASGGGGTTTVTSAFQFIVGEEGDEGRPGFQGLPGTPGAAGATGPTGPAGPAAFGVGIPGEAGDDGLMIWQQASTPVKTRAITFVFDNGTSVIANTMKKVYIYVPYACLIIAVTLLADQAGAAVLGIKKCAFGSFPGSLTNIVASAPPTITATNQSAQDTTLTGWTTTIVAGDVLEISVTSGTTITSVFGSLTVTV